MGKLKKVFDQTYAKGVVNDDCVTAALYPLNHVSHKPYDTESELVNGDVGDMSYYTIYDKKFRIVVYIEE